LDQGCGFVLSEAWACFEELSSVSCPRCGSNKLLINGKKTTEFEGVYDGDRIVEEKETDPEYYIHGVECAECKEDLSDLLL